MIENVLFDLDGTLVDSLPGIQSTITETLSELLPNEIVGDIRQFIGPPVGQVFKKILGDIEKQTLDALVEDFRSKYDDHGWQKTIGYKGVKNTISDLSKSGLKSFVVTNKPILPTRLILQELGLISFFQDVVAPDSKEPNFKSKTDMAVHVIEKHGLDSKKTIIVGDSVDDGQVAQSLQIGFVAATYGYGDTVQTDLLKKWTITSFSDLLDILLGH